MMKDLSLHLESLLLDHDSVVYPQLGTFTTTYVPSRWSPDEDLFLPPYRTVSFSAEVSQEDELFVTTLAKRYRVSQSDAGVMCAEYLDYIHQELSENGAMDLGSIGVFVQENDDEPLIFYPAPAGVASPEFYGLDAFHVSPAQVRPVAVGETKRKTALISTAGSDEHHIIIHINRTAAEYVATAAACLLLFFGISKPVQSTDSTLPQAAETEFFLPTNLIPSVAAQPVEATAEAEPASQAPAAAAEELPGSYAIVLASAISMKNAENFVQKLRSEGHQAQVYVKGNMVRVIIPGFDTQEAGYSQIRQMKAGNSRYAKAWLMQLGD